MLTFFGVHSTQKVFTFLSLESKKTNKPARTERYVRAGESSRTDDPDVSGSPFIHKR
jgi:hypothetical protein